MDEATDGKVGVYWDYWLNSASGIDASITPLPCSILLEVGGGARTACARGLLG